MSALLAGSQSCVRISGISLECKQVSLPVERLTFVTLGRPLLADPNWVQQAETGEPVLRQMLQSLHIECSASYLKNRADAIRAPSLIAFSLAQTTSSETRPIPADVSKPQSVAAIT